VIWRPFNLVLLLAFLIGIALAGWQQYERQHGATPNQTQIALLPARAVAVHPVPQNIAEVIAKVQSAAPAISEPEPVRRALSADPTQLAAPVPQPYEEPASLAAVVVPPAPAVTVTGTPRIAIVIDDLGPDWRGSLAAVRLPAPVTLALLPYAERVQEIAARGKAAGHELILHMPMEPQDIAHNDPGPGVLLSTDSAEVIRQKLTQAFASFDGYVGLNNHMGSRFTAYLPGMDVAMGELARRNLYFLDSRTSGQTVGQTLATRVGLRFVGRDVFLDNELTEASVLAQLRQTERIARRNGQAVAIGHPHAATLAVLQRWIPEARRAGFELVPLSALAQRQNAPLIASQR
jgi:polysaccharide deacetylase 2 family uncharacterized protein YibQ